jgi:hypothetical protein
MIKKLTLTLVCLGLLFGCATTQPQRTFENNTFSSDLPELKVEIHKTIKNQGDNSNRYGREQNYSWWWYVGNKEGVGIAIKVYHKSTSHDYYYSLEDITGNWGRIPLEPLHIKGHKWLKYAYINKKNYLHTGFFTRKGDCFISVYRYAYLRDHMDEIEKLDETRTLTGSQEQLLDIAFNETDKLFTIEY